MPSIFQPCVARFIAIVELKNPILCTTTPEALFYTKRINCTRTATAGLYYRPNHFTLKNAVAYTPTNSHAKLPRWWRAPSSALISGFFKAGDAHPSQQHESEVETLGAIRAALGPVSIALQKLAKLID